MKNCCLNIAGYIIRFESSDDGPELVPSERFLRNICDDANHDLFITVHSGSYNLPDDAEKVFDAPYVEEINGIRTKKSDRFWSIHKHHDDLYIKTDFPLSLKNKNAVLKYSLSDSAWELRMNGKAGEVDPMEYPLDGLILYYLTVTHGDIMIHASGINNAGTGYLFSGISGKGKSTIASLWDRFGARVIHDDRLIIRNTGSRYVMYNTPVYINDVPRESPIDRIFLIDHGKKNEIIPVRGAEAVSLIMANCIQHNWDPGMVARLLGSVSIIAAKIPVARLFFRPDMSVINHILENEQG